MADVEYLKTFVDDEKILASDTNNNNQYLLAQINTQIGKTQTYVETQISSLSSSVSSQISTLNSTLNQNVPTGVIQAYTGSSAPTGWLLCDGSAVSRTTYSALFAVIGTTFGEGDGSTTFNIPDLVDKFVEGATSSGTVKAAGLPNITGGVQVGGYGSYPIDVHPSGCFYGSNAGNFMTRSEHGGSCDRNFNIDASRSSSIYGKSSTVQPPALTMLYIIKY